MSHTSRDNSPELSLNNADSNHDNITNNINNINSAGNANCSTSIISTTSIGNGATSPNSSTTSTTTITVAISRLKQLSELSQSKQESISTNSNENKISDITLQRIEAINNIHPISKLLYFLSLVSTFSFIIVALKTVVTIIIFNDRSNSCGDRSLTSISYPFQRISLTFFFIARLRQSFINSIYRIRSGFIILFFIITIVVYVSAAAWYISIAYMTQYGENGFYCNGTQLTIPTVVIGTVDLMWNLFLGLLFSFKLRQVSNCPCLLINKV